MCSCPCCLDHRMAIQVPDGVFSFHTQTRTVRSGRYFTAVHHEQAARILKHVQEITVLSFRALHPVKLACREVVIRGN